MGSSLGFYAVMAAAFEHLQSFYVSVTCLWFSYSVQIEFSETLSVVNQVISFTRPVKIRETVEVTGEERRMNEASVTERQRVISLLVRGSA